MTVIIGLFVPFALIALGGGVRTLVRKSLEIRDYFLGIPFALATLTTSVTYGIDLAQRTAGKSDEERLAQLFKLLVYGVFATVVFVSLVITHQTWEARIEAMVNGARRKRASLKLFFVSNLTGSICFALFLLLIKRPT